MLLAAAFFVGSSGPSHAAVIFDATPVTPGPFVQGTSFTLVITVRGDETIGSAGFTLTWDSAVLTWNANAMSPSFPSGGGLSLAPIDRGGGEMGTGFAWNNAEGFALNETPANVFTVNFTASGSPMLYENAIRFEDGPPTDLEVTDEFGSPLDSVTFNPASITIAAIPEPANIALALCAGIFAAWKTSRWWMAWRSARRVWESR